MPKSYDVTYQGDTRFPDKKSPFELHGFPFHFPIGKPVEITQEFIKETFNREESVHDFVTFLFDGPKAVWNLHLKAPRFTVTEHVSETPAAGRPKRKRKPAKRAQSPAVVNTPGPTPESHAPTDTKEGS